MSRTSHNMMQDERNEEAQLKRLRYLESLPTALEGRPLTGLTELQREELGDLQMKHGTFTERCAAQQRKDEVKAFARGHDHGLRRIFNANPYKPPNLKHQYKRGWKAGAREQQITAAERDKERVIDDRTDVDQANPCEYSEDYDWSKHDFDNDPDWR